MEQPQSENRPMKEDYRKDWQQYYADNPYTVTDKEMDSNAKEYAEAMEAVFDELGITDLMNDKSLTLVASSVSTGEKDIEFLQKLNQSLSSDAPQSRVIMTDYAVADGTPIIEQPQAELTHLAVQSIVSDSYHMPLADEAVDVLYERLGALYHCADEDIEKGHQGKLVADMLAEYKRILKPKGRIIIDWANSKVPVSTALEMEKAADGALDNYLSNQGYEVQYAGDKEGYIILTKVS
jgi:SAM-dependent methyltransferase